MSKACLITGASGGIGQALVRVFRASGYHVIATDVAPMPSNALKCDFFGADLARFVTDESYAAEVIAGIRARLIAGKLHVLINNAAVQILGGTETLTRQEWHATLAVNLLAPFLLTQVLLPELEEARGSVINIGSIHARLTKKNFVAYATSKAALAGLTRALAVDLGPRVRVNCIEPAAIETAMLKAGFEAMPERYAQLANCHPQQRIGQPEEVARLALAIAEGGFEFLHGASLSLDGGVGGRLYDPE